MRESVLPNTLQAGRGQANDHGGFSHQPHVFD